MKKAFLLLLALSVCAIADNDAASEIPFAVNFDATSEVKSEPAPTVSEVKSEESQEAKTEAKSKPTKAAHKAKPKAKAKASQKSKDEVEAKPEETAHEDAPVADVPEEKTADTTTATGDDSVKDSKFTIYIHPFNFLVPYSHFWAGVKVPNGLTDYPSFNLTFEWNLFEMSSLMTMPHFVRVDRSDDDYKIYDIGLQESFRWYNLGGHRWRYLQLGLLLSHLHIETEKDGDFDGWLYGFMFNVGMKKVLNGGEGFLGHFAVSVDVGLGYAFTSDFKGDRKGGYFRMDKGFTIDVNAAFGFQI
ncbi:hypothetical protein [Fibrobacter sp.]|uniref:hypothetical protein n=1 Tax=Fibrobacter sp. TaxID=35828 RepID=UPI0025B87AE0|nr:hypothetical protein [Fibrobacter sp.]MBR3073960.1 hypothetical protein [Fibrobacter sp.]